jgi:copper chaperone
MTIADQTIHNYSVPGISCGHCKAAIEGEVTKVSGVTGIAVDIDAKTVFVSGGDDASIRDAIDEAGYDIA